MTVTQDEVPEGWRLLSKGERESTVAHFCVGLTNGEGIDVLVWAGVEVMPEAPEGEVTYEWDVPDRIVDDASKKYMVESVTYSDQPGNPNVGEVKGFYDSLEEAEEDMVTMAREES